MTSGTYDRTYINDGDGGIEEADPATVSAFRLDKYNVTVGRFRQFVSAWYGGAGYTLPVGSGKHAHLNAGQGLANSGSAGTYEPGWVTGDNGNVQPTMANLTCATSGSPWTASTGENEKLPIGCVNWFESSAFCIWDGGFLPSESEWEYAAAGGSQQREYPWGTTAPGTATQFGLKPVGTPTLDAGLWGQLDLVGNGSQWNLDGYNSSYVNPCTDCAFLTPVPERASRGGYSDGLSSLTSVYRDHFNAFDRAPSGGFRCARAH